MRFLKVQVERHGAKFARHALPICTHRSRELAAELAQTLQLDAFAAKIFLKNSFDLNRFYAGERNHFPPRENDSFLTDWAPLC